MDKQTKLDDFLKDKVDTDLGYEYREEDWNKAFTLISNQKNERVFWTFSKKIVSIVAIIVAFLFAILQKESKEQVTQKQKSSKPSATAEQKDKVKAETSTSSNSPAVETAKTIVAIDANKSMASKSNNASDKTNNSVESQSNTSLESKGTASNNSTQNNTKNTYASNLNKDAKSAMTANKKSTEIESEVDLNEKLDYAEAGSKKTKFSLDKINPFKKIKTNTSIQDNYRNLQVAKKAVNDTSWNDFATYNQRDGADKEFKKIKPYSVQLLAGATAYKPFSGNMAHASAPVFGPLVGLDFNLYFNKKTSLGLGIIYSERGGINSRYYLNQNSGDSTLVVISKISSLELPVSFVYRISKNSSCYGGLALNYYVSNKTNLPGSKANGIISMDGYALAGYMYEVNNKLSIKLNTLIGFRDVTSNQTFNSDSREDNVGIRVIVGYKFFNHE